MKLYIYYLDWIYQELCLVPGAQANLVDNTFLEEFYNNTLKIKSNIKNAKISRISDLESVHTCFDLIWVMHSITPTNTQKRILNESVDANISYADFVKKIKSIKRDHLKLVG